MSFQHAIVWLDHHEARIIDFAVDEHRIVTVHDENGPRQLHRKASVIGTGKSAPNKQFFEDVVGAIGDAREILVTGPGTAKTELQRLLGARHPQVAKRVVGVETLDHPSDSELLNYGRQYFKRVDALLGVRTSNGLHQER
jgi:stalled ribosome rescue protein Dom34